MKLRTKLALLGLSAGMIAFQLGSCLQFLGDLAGDALWLRGID
jgi:hypothetical protein